MEWFQKAAEQGRADAQCKLGLMYKNGTGVERSYEKAREWFLKARGWDLLMHSTI